MFFPFGIISEIMFNIVPIIIVIGFIVVFGMIIMTFINGIGEWNKNNNSPILTVDALLVTKRTTVSHRSSSTNDSHFHGHTSTTYYATFEVESKDRIEFSITGTEYGMLAEKDLGTLTFQGTRYLGFERKK